MLHKHGKFSWVPCAVQRIDYRRTNFPSFNSEASSHGNISVLRAVLFGIFETIHSGIKNFNKLRINTEQKIT